MRPKITCHMITSLDGRLLPERWMDPANGRIGDLIDVHYESVASRLNADGWIVGRKTMADFVKQHVSVDLLETPMPRKSHFAERGQRQIGVAIDPGGRLDFVSDDVGGDQAVVILSERVPDTSLERLRAAGVSYVFAGPEGRDLSQALEQIGKQLNVRHLLLEGGGVTNGAFLAAGLIDALSTLICPTLDGLAGVQAIYDHLGTGKSQPASGQHLALQASETLKGGVVWLRHDVTRDA
ncbi:MULTISPECIES: dihydrofolate reductase family protein [unclassified Halomonas]|uniref:RibD family protein n=1 Tax=unclassified Halomonas TaxID=2609666 RepID=UPI0021F7C06E|nr:MULTISPECIES: dihydrofolate reductase family protein [unclassified Halomonas]